MAPETRLSARARLLLTCEHARAAVPEGIDLRLDPRHLATHIAHDRGAFPIARGLEERTGAPLHAGSFTRLVVDLNRMEDNPDVIAVESHGVVIAGNAALDAAGRRERLETWHRPWRAAVLADAQAFAREGHCLHLSLHSFDPAVDPPNRGFDAGVLFDPARAPERDHARALQSGLVAAGFSARLNEPFAGTPEGVTSWLRGQIPEDRYTGIELEASYAWVDDGARIAAYVAAVARVVEAITLG